MKSLFKYASLLAAAAMLFSCEEKVDTDDVQNLLVKKPLVVVSDKNFIQATGEDFATVTVTLDGAEVTEGVTFMEYKGGNKYDVINIPDFRFSATEAKDYSIRALYGTYISDPMTIRAIVEDVPATPVDEKPGSTDFVAKVLANEFTTAGCSACPVMKSSLHDAFEKVSGMEDKVILTECHSSLVNGKADRAYIKTTYEGFAGCQGFPFLHVDMWFGTSHMTTWTYDNYVAILNQCYDKKNGIAAGIAVNSVLLDPEVENGKLLGGKVVAKVTVKAAESGPYYVGAMLLEDDIYEEQVGATSAQEWMKTRDNVIRYIDAMEYLYDNKGNRAGEHYFGHYAGDIQKGRTADYIFIWDLGKIWAEGSYAGSINGGREWESFVAENLHFVVYTCTEDKDGRYFVSNVVDCDLNGETPYDYK